MFLDAGNTLLSMDFVFLSELAGEHGLPFSSGVLERAEAAARPAVDRWLAEIPARSTESKGTLLVYVRSLLEEAARRSGGALPPARIERKAAELAETLSDPRTSDRIWTRVPEGLPESLSGLKEAGIKLAVVSNADGTVEAKLERAGLRGYFDAILDSGRLGVEKPSPGIFLEAAARLGLPPSSCLHAGDLVEVDVRGALGAGVHAVLIDPFGDRGEVLCPTFASATRLAARLLEAASRRKG